MIKELKEKIAGSEVSCTYSDRLKFLVVCRAHLSSRAKSFIFAFNERQPQPLFLVKVARTERSAASLQNAHRCLLRLEGLHLRGKRFYPQPLYCGEINGTLAQVETYEEGQIMAKRLRPWRGESELLSLLQWLQEFHISTSSPMLLDKSLLEEKIIFYLHRVREIVRGDAVLEGYLDQFNENIGKLIGLQLRFVFAHNNLSLLNLKFDREANIKVLDWEDAQPLGLPLLDFYHLLYSYYKARNRQNSARAYRQILQGRIDSHLKIQLESYCRKLDITPFLQDILIRFFLLFKITQVESYRQELLAALRELA